MGCLKVASVMCIVCEVCTSSTPQQPLLFLMQVQVAKARLAQAEGPYPGNVQAAEQYLQQAVLVRLIRCNLQPL